MAQSKLGVPRPAACGLRRDGRWSDQVLSRRGQLLSRLAARPSLAGNGLLERMRSTAFALLGVTAAMGLGLVALIAQQGWPVLPFSPIPGPPVGHVAVHEATAVARSPRGASKGAGHRVRARALPAAGPPPVQAPSPGSRLAGAHQVASHQAPPPSPGDGQPGGGDGSQPTPAGQAAPAPAPSAPPATAPPPPDSSPVATAPSPSQGSVASSSSHGRGKTSSGSKEKGHQSEAESHSPAPPPTPPVETQAGSPGQVEPSPGPEESPGSSGRGRGHAYGHDR